jgi:hypothetical protein
MVVTAGVSVAIGAGVLPGFAAAHPSAPAGARPLASSTASGSTAAGPLTVLSQSSTVAPGQPFDLQLRASDSSVPTAALGVTVAVYSCLSSVSAFDQSVSASSGPSGTPISSTPTPLAVSGLPAVAGRGFDLSMPVVVGSNDAGSTPGGFTIDLTSASGQCGLYPSGVYPVRVELVDTADKQVIAGITTHLVYADAAAGTQKLRVAIVLPVQIAPVPATTPATAQLLAQPGSALDPPSAAAVANLSALVGAVAAPAHAGVAVTLEVSPQTVTALAESGHQSLVTDLATLGATPSVHQFASTSFTPVNAATLVDAGLSGELAAQVSRGTQALASAIHQPSASGAAGLGAWITNDALDPATLTQLASAGFDQVILPAAGVSSSPTDGSTAEPFPLATTHGPPMTAIASNGDVASRFTGAPGDPVLAAHQLAAELAQMYYEKPNATTPRAVVAVAPNGWVADPAFVTALLGALAGNPILQPVTASGLFAAVGAPTPCRDGCRLLGGPGAGLPVAAIRLQRQRVNGFASAAPSAHALSGDLSDLVLTGESELLRPGVQTRVLDNAGSALNAQLTQFAVGDQTITLTSNRASVPISIESSAPYPVLASLTLTSDQLLFVANRTNQLTVPIPLHGHTNIVDVTVQSRGSGVSKVEVSVRSPGGGLQLSSGEVEVRSTATSVVGIVLSLGAVVVLAVWWVRTSRKRRALRRGQEAEDAGTPAGIR